MTPCTCPDSGTPRLSAGNREALAQVFKALGHPVRLMIVDMLLDGERCVCELHEHSGRDMSTISSHLNQLKACGLLASEQRGKNVYYSLRWPCIRQVLHCLSESLPPAP